MSKLVVHHQIPKTATNSITSLLQESFGRERTDVVKVIADRTSRGDILVVRPECAESVDIWQHLRELPGHIRALSVLAPFGFQQALKADVFLFALVREPIARLQSYWDFICRLAAEGRPAMAAVMEADYDLDVILTRMPTLSFFNEQTRMISGATRLWISEEEFRVAKENVEVEYAFVGTVETIDVSVAELARRLRLGHLQVGRLNSAGESYSYRMTGRQKRILTELNEWDAKLHDWISRRVRSRAN